MTEFSLTHTHTPKWSVSDPYKTTHTHSPCRGCIQTLAARTRPAVRETVGTSCCLFVPIYIYIYLYVCVYACVCGSVECWVLWLRWLRSYILIRLQLDDDSGNFPLTRVFVEHWICGISGLSYLPLAWPLPLPGCTGVIRRHFVEWTAWLARCVRGAGRTCREKYHWPVTSCRPITVNLLASTDEFTQHPNWTLLSSTNSSLLSLLHCTDM